jgi:hypothetical protein
MIAARILLTAILFAALSVPLRVRAAADAPFTPPSAIGLRVMRLTANGGNTGSMCDVSLDEKSFGCGSNGYPYASNPITISIETDYLLNVIPQEMPLSFATTAIEAQATAARSFTYWYARRGTLINNSISYQAFVPGKFIAVSGVTPDNAADPCASGNLGARQAKLCAAMANPRYMTRFDSDVPVFAQFSADWPERTRTNANHKALRAVDDPISNTTNGECISDGAGSHGWGMVQNGANRWARGYQCAYSTKAPWTVTWGTADQILTHYYTGIHLRTAAAPLREKGLLERVLTLFAGEAASMPGDITTPDWRWNPLQIDGLPESMPVRQSTEATTSDVFVLDVHLQNTGVYTWTCGQGAGCFSLGYVWTGAQGQVYTGTTWAELPCSVPPGDPSARTSLNIDDRPAWPAGAYTLTLDMRAHTDDGRVVWFSEQGWPAYDIPITLTEGGVEGRRRALAAGTAMAYVPFVQNEAAAPAATPPGPTATPQAIGCR